MKIFFDIHGNLKSLENNELIVASSFDKSIYIYSDFDTSLNSSLVSTITFKRADGIVLGPFEAEKVFDANGFICRKLLIDSKKKDILAVPGPLEFTVRYDQYGFNESHELIKVCSKALAKCVANVLNAAGGLPDDTGIYFLLDKVNQHDIKIKKLEETQIQDELEISIEEPVDKTVNKLWFKIK